MPVLKATIADTIGLVKLVNSAYRGETSKIGWTTEAHLLEGTRIDEETMRAYLEDPRVDILKYVADDGQILGCVYLEAKGRDLYLGMLTVSPWHQTNGIGKVLLNAAEEHCRQKKCKGLEITVITTRHELIAWYERRGFVKTGEKRPFPMTEKFGIAKQPFGLLVMYKRLT